jgi:hypothetical protein
MRKATLWIAAVTLSLLAIGCGDESTASDPAKSGKSTIDMKSDGTGAMPSKAGATGGGGGSEAFRSPG